MRDHPLLRPAEAATRTSSAPSGAASRGPRRRARSSPTSLGLEAVFLHGFDGAAVAGEFFADPGISAIFVAGLGYPSEPNS